MTDKPVIIAALALRAFPFLPLVSWPGRVHLGPSGEVVIVRSDGGVDPVIHGGQPHPGVAADPVPGRRA